MANIVLPPGLTDLHCKDYVVKENPYITNLIHKELDKRGGKAPEKHNFRTETEWRKAWEEWYKLRRELLVTYKTRIIAEALREAGYKNPDVQEWVEPFSFKIESSYECVKYYRYYYKINSKYYDFSNRTYRDSYTEYGYKLNDGGLQDVKVTLVGGLQAALDELPLPHQYVKNEKDPHGYSIPIPKPDWLDSRYPTFVFLRQDFTRDILEVYGEVVHKVFGYLDESDIKWKYTVAGSGSIRDEKGNEKNGLQGVQERINLWPRKYIPAEHIYKQDGKDKVKRDVISKIGSVKKPVLLEDTCGRKYKSNQWIADLFCITSLNFKHSVKTFSSTYDENKPCYFLEYNPNHRFAAYPSWKEKNDILGDHLIK